MNRAQKIIAEMGDAKQLAVQIRKMRDGFLGKVKQMAKRAGYKYSSDVDKKEAYFTFVNKEKDRELFIHSYGEYRGSHLRRIVVTTIDGKEVDRYDFDRYLTSSRTTGAHISDHAGYKAALEGAAKWVDAHL